MILNGSQVKKAQSSSILKALPPDDDVYNELISTTQTRASSGRLFYHPAKRDEEHQTDALRAVMLAIHVLISMDVAEHDEWIDEQPWVNTGDRSGWKPPWSY